MQTQQGWYFVDGEGQQVGPMALDQLKGHATSGMVAAHTLVWSEGMEEWLPVSSVQGILAPAPAPLAAPAPTLQRPQVNLGAQPQVNPYTTPQANMGMSAAMAPNPGLKNLLLSFEGRIPRRTFWGATLSVTGVYYAIFFGLMIALGKQSSVFLGLVFVLYIPLFWCLLAIQCKRWHDRDKSGWWYFISMVPLIGGVWAFVECGCLRGSFGANSYGEDPT